MALVECSECRKSVSQAAIACPHCGQPLSRELPDGVTGKARRPLLLMGGLAWAAFFFLQGLVDVAVILGIVDEKPAALEAITGLLLLAGLILLIYGVISKYVLHHGLPVKSIRGLRAALICVSGGAFLLIMTSLTIPAIHAAKQAGELHTFTTQNKKLSLQLPNGWEENNDSDTPGLQLKMWAPITASHFAVLIEDKSAVAGMSLHAYTAAIRNLIKGQLKDATLSDPVPGEVDGRSGLLTEIHAKSNDVSIGMLIVILEDTNCFWQLRLWTGESEYPHQRDEFERIVDSSTFSR